MSKIKLLIGTLVVIAALFAAGQITPAFAAHALPEATVTATPPAPITVTIQSIELVTDNVTHVTTVKVSYLDSASGATSTVSLSVETAAALGLVTLDASGQPVVNLAAIGTQVTIDPATIIPEPTDTGFENPVGAAIASFFGLDYQTVAGFHDDGAGYGVIAQACWLSYQLKGDASMCAAIIDAKHSGDFSSIPLPDGSTASNWGQFKKGVYGSSHKHNLGEIISGHADPILPDATVTPAPHNGGAQDNSTLDHPGNSGNNLPGQGSSNGQQGGGNHGKSGQGNGHGKHK